MHFQLPLGEKKNPKEIHFVLDSFLKYTMKSNKEYIVAIVTYNEFSVKQKAKNL